jgi:phosphohistidine phosphatase SixA
MIRAHVSRRLGRLVPVLAVVLVITSSVAAEESKEAWAALVDGGHVAVIRHGNAPPGHGGDPPGMKIDDCTTQRNLDDIGREQSRALGEAFRKLGVRVGRVVSSPMCRCMETGRLMGVGPVETSWALLPGRLSELKEMISSWRGPGTLVLVTHALTVRPLTGFLPEQAETVVLRPTPGDPRGGSLVGRIALPQ